MAEDFSAPGFSPDFPTWLLKTNFVDEVPFTKASQQWLDKVCSSSLCEKQLWQQVHQKVKRSNLARCMQQDWSKGGRLHAGVVALYSGFLGQGEAATFQTLKMQQGRPIAASDVG